MKLNSLNFQVKKKMMSAKRKAHVRLYLALKGGRPRRKREKASESATDAVNPADVQSSDIQKKTKITIKDSVGSEVSHSEDVKKERHTNKTEKAKSLKRGLVKKKRKHNANQESPGLKSKLSEANTGSCSSSAKRKILKAKKKKKSVESDIVGNDSKKCLADGKEIMQFEFVENALMTQFDGIWVKRTSLPQLENAQQENMKRIYLARKDGNQSKELTNTEQKAYHQSMKKKIRKEYRNLRRELTKQRKHKAEGKEG